MDDYISRQSAIEAAKHAWAKGLEPTQYIEIIPTADVKKVLEGKWIQNIVIIENEYYQLGWKCSICGRVELNKEQFCHCGAMMMEEQDG